MAQQIFDKKVILITGASSGIGYELAKQCFSQGASLFLLARREDKLRELAQELDPSGKQVHTFVGDVTQSQDLKTAVDQCVSSFGRLDIAIANAGFGVAGNVSDLKIEDYRRQLETNVFGVLNTVYAVEKALENTQGQLVLIGSVAGFVPLPGNSAYTMSKFCIRALATALRYEWKSRGIAVTHIAPGFVDSDIRRVDNQGVLKAGHPDPIPAWIRMSTPAAVSEILKAVKKRKAQQVITTHGKLILWFNQYWPQLIPWIISMGGLKARQEPK